MYAPDLTDGHAARYWCMDGSRAGGQEGKRAGGRHQGNPLPHFAHFAHFDRGKLRRPALDPGHKGPHLRRRECWNLYLFGIRPEPLMRKALRDFSPHGAAHAGAGAGAGAGAAGDITPAADPAALHPPGRRGTSAVGEGFSLSEGRSFSDSLVVGNNH